jgi:hypothetical protein
MCRQWPSLRCLVLLCLCCACVVAMFMCQKVVLMVFERHGLAFLSFSPSYVVIMLLLLLCCFLAFDIFALGCSSTLDLLLLLLSS